MSTAELHSWLQDPEPRTFPYAAVLREYHSVGKHFVEKELLDLLGQIRTRLPSLTGPWSYTNTLMAFLNTALDKPDGRYNYPTYLALPLIKLPSIQDPVEQAAFARSRCDRLISHLMADTLRFELAAASGETNILPDMRPAEKLITKRYRLGVRTITPALKRMSLDNGLTATQPDELARQVCAMLYADMSWSERRGLSLSILPVYTAHDEYLFLRVLQMFETTFSLLVVQLNGALTALAERDVDRAIHYLELCRAALNESAPLFSMLATMQTLSFQTFREFTEGASAIQSRNYKTLESLCRQPDPDRVDSAAYYSVPEVRRRVLAGQQTLDDALQEILSAGDLPGEDKRRLHGALHDFAKALLRWRQTHFRLATRMLGQKTGTGYTEGTPYLDATRNIPVFSSIQSTILDAESAHDHESIAT